MLEVESQTDLDLDQLEFMHISTVVVEKEVVKSGGSTERSQSQSDQDQTEMPAHILFSTFHSM